MTIKKFFGIFFVSYKLIKINDQKIEKKAYLKNKMSTSSYFIKPITSFLKESNTPGKYIYPDQENQENEPQKTYKIPTSITRMIPPQIDENILRSQQKTMFNLSEQIRQLKINNESLARGNAGLEKELDDKNNKLSYYEDVLLRLYKEKPLKTQTSGLKHRFGTQEQKEIEELIETITLKKQVSKENEEIKQEKKAIHGPIDFFSKKKENSTQTDALPLSINLENFVNENYSPRYSPKNSPRHSPKNRSPQSPRGKNEGFSQKISKQPQNKESRQISLFGNDKDYHEKVRENIGKIRLDINNVFKNIKDISRGISNENVCFGMCFPFFLEDSDEEIVQFRDSHMYNMRSNISLWSLFYKTIEFFLKCFRFWFEFQWFFPCFRSRKNVYLSHQDIFNKFNRVFSCRLDKAFNKSAGTPENYEKEVFLAFLSLYDDIPSNDNKTFYSGSSQQEDWKTNRFSKKRTQKPKSKVVNLETKYLIYLICEKLKGHAKIFKMYFSKNRTLYLFFNFDSTNKEQLVNYFKKSNDFLISLDEELLQLIKLEPFDSNNVPLSLKIYLNQLSFDEIHNFNKNRVVPIKETSKKPLDTPKKQGFNKLLEKKDVEKENKENLPNEIEQKPQEEAQNIDLERVQLKSEAFYQQKKTFLIKNWFKLQESLDFSRFLFVLKEKLIMSRSYKLTLKEIDFYEKFIEKFAFYISNKILINYESTETRIFDLNSNDPDYFKIMKKLDFSEISNVLNKTLNLLQSEDKSFSVFKNYWMKNQKKPGKMWLKANDELIPLDFVENYLFLPKLLVERNIFHNIAIYFPYKPNLLFENEGFALLYDEKQLSRQIIKEIIQISDLNMLKTSKCFYDIFMTKEFVEENNVFSLLKEHFSFFSMSPNAKLFIFYEKLHKFIGNNTAFLLAFSDFIAIFMKIMIVPGIASFVLMSYYERSSVEYKATIMVYSFLIILAYTIINKIALRYLSQYKSNMGIIQVQIDKGKKIIYKDFDNENLELLLPIKDGFMSKCKYYSKKLIIFVEMMVIFLGLFAIKTYITYGFNLLKVEWVQNQTIEIYNFYFDINQFLPDLFDFMLIPIFMTIFKKFVFRPTFNYYIINEKAFKDTLCIFFRAFCEFSCFFQIIFIYPSIENCVKNDCLSMCQQAYKNMLVIYFFYKTTYWIYCYVKGERIFDLKKSFENTLISNRAYKSNPNAQKINEIKKESILNTENNEKKTEELELSPNKLDGKMKKFVHLNEITNKIMINLNMDSLFYKNTVIEKTYEIIIDSIVFMLYHIAFSSMFSLDGIYLALLFYFECFFNKYKIIFLYKTFFSNEKTDFSHLKFCFFFIIVCGIIFNMGLLAFLYETFFDFKSIGAFFALVFGMIIICFFIFFVFSDLFEETKDKLIEHRHIFNRLFNFLK